MSGSRWFLAPRINLELDEDAWRYVASIFPSGGRWIFPTHVRVYYGPHLVVDGPPEAPLETFQAEVSSLGRA